MIEKNVNIRLNERLKRIVEYDKDQKQINFLDQRFYQRKKNVFYPSVTYILNYFPKNKYFESWLKDVGHSADFIVKEAASEGTQVHNAVEEYLRGNEVEWIDEYGNAKYSLKVWKMILNFVNFWEEHKPKLIGSEIHLFSDEYKFAGTTDLILEIEGQVWLLDIKTSNSLHKSQELQLSAYAKSWNSSFDQKIDRIGILWLKSKSRTPDPKKKKLKGKNWEIKEPEDSIEDNFELFMKIYDLFKLENKILKPYSELFPTVIKLKNE
jgi:hypothetical protein